MKRSILPVFWLLLGLMTLATAPACKTKSGCPSNEQVQPRVNKKGELIGGKRNRNHSELFDKKRRKRMGR